MGKCSIVASRYRGLGLFEAAETFRNFKCAEHFLTWNPSGRIAA